MTTSERKSRKIYYTMGEVSEMFDVNPSLIRFWEQKFDILKPDKNKKGNRLFTPKDVENLKLYNAFINLERIFYMSNILILAFLFFAGCLIGWGIEVIFRRFEPNNKA